MMYDVVWKEENLVIRRENDEAQNVEIALGVDAVDTLRPFYHNLYMAVKVLANTTAVPFHFRVGIKETPVRRAVVLELYVDPAEFRRQWHAKHFVTGETYVTRMLHDSIKQEALFLRKGSGGAAALTTTARRKRPRAASSDVDADDAANTTGVQLTASQRDMAAWMKQRERAMVTDSVTVQYLSHVVVPDTGVVFCLDQFVFMALDAVSATTTTPAVTRAATTVRLRGGLVIGERNAGKSLVVKDLIYTGRDHLESGSRSSSSSMRSAPRVTAPVLKPLHATLLVVPSSLVMQWHEYFQEDESVVCINTHQARRKVKAARVEAARVVIVSHRVFLSHLCSVSHDDRIRARVFAASKPSLHATGDDADFDVDFEAVHLNWYLWDRIVVDEVLQFRAEQMRMRIREVQGGSGVWYESLVWWGLQGDVCPTSPALLPLIRVMCASSRGLGAGEGMSVLTACCRAVVDVDDFYRASIYAAPPLPHTSLELWIERTIFSGLTRHEQSVYDTLVHLDAPDETLRRVCAGDISFMNKYMVTVERWADAIPLGIEAINQCMLFNEPYEDGDGDGDGDDDSDLFNAPPFAARSSVAAAVMRVQEVNVDDFDVDGRLRVGDVDDGGDGGDGGGDGDDDNDNDDTVAETRFLVELARDILERRDFFLKTVVQLSQKQATPSVCGVCLTNTCDCIFVCGHMLCHICIIDLFDSSAKNNTAYPEIMAPCPTCRWNIEPNEVFWVLNQPLVDPSKFDGLLAVARRGGTTVVFSDSPSVLRFWYQKCTTAATGVSSKLLCSPMQLCSPSYTSWFGCRGSRGKHPQLLFVYIGKGAGLKLHGVSNVVFMQPATAALEREALKCIVTDPQAPTVSIVRLVSTHTVEFPCNTECH
jgi:hypothetical protein